MRMLLGFVFAFVLIASAQGQSARTFVSARTGSDLNSCTGPAPCRSFYHAIPLTAPDGEVIVLDSGGYGTIHVTQGLSVEVPEGVYAGVTATAGFAVEINAPATSVYLQGLTIVNMGASRGIYYTAGSVLTVDRCLIRDAIQSGIEVNGGLRLNMLQSTLAGCAVGVKAFADSGTAKATIEGCTFLGNGAGVTANPGSTVLLSNSLIVGSTYGALAQGFFGFAGINSQLIIENCRFAHNVDSVLATGAATGEHGTVWISSSTITDSSSRGLRQTSTGVVYSRGNNTIEGNATDVVGTITLFSGK